MTEDKNIKHEIIDNFLPQEVFKFIQAEFMGISNFSTRNDTVGWGYCLRVEDKDIDIKENWKYFYMSHLVYDNGRPVSPLFEKMIPILNKMDIKAIKRIKCNLFPNSEKIHEHEMHEDFEFSLGKYLDV